MAKKNQKKTKPIKLRLFANNEQAWNVIRPSVGAFDAIRQLALRSTRIGLARKFEICKELALDWREELGLENRKGLDELLKQLKTHDPALLGEKILKGRGIKQRFGKDALTPFETAMHAVPVLFRDDAGNVPSIGEGSIDELLPGNVERAIAFFFDQINIPEGEDLGKRTTFRAFVGSEKEYPLAPVSVGNLRRLNALQVAVPSLPEKDRQDICQEMRWHFDKITPEKVTDMKPKTTYWTEAAQIVLQGVDITDSNNGKIDAGEVNRALMVFFARSDGML